MIAAACVLVPPLAAAVLAVLPAGWGARANLLAAAITFGLTACLPWAPATGGGWLLADGLAVQLAVLTGFVGLTAAWFSLGHAGAEMEEGRLTGARLRVYHVLFQVVSGGALLAVLSDDPGITWAALAAAAVAAAFAPGLPGTPGAAQAARRGFVPVWAGAALALFGTVALHAAALPVLGPGGAAMTWSGLVDAAPGVPGAMLTLAGAPLIVGCATLAALAPLHGWMPGSRAAGPTPALAVLSGVVPVAALAVLLRLRGVLAVNPEAMPPGPPLLALGVLSVLLAGFGLWRCRDAAGFFALCATGQRGVVCLGFGLGTPAATSGGLLHLAAHTLAGAAVLQCVGAGGVARPEDGRYPAHGGGPAPSHPASRAPFAAGVAALAGLPPFGVFAGGYLVLAEVAREAPWLLVPAGAGLLAGSWALVARLQDLYFGRLGAPAPDPAPDWNHRDALPPRGDAPRETGSAGDDPDRGDVGGADEAPGRAALAGAWLNLAAALALGLLLPAPVAAWMRAAAEALP